MSKFLYDATYTVRGEIEAADEDAAMDIAIAAAWDDLVKGLGNDDIYVERIADAFTPPDPFSRKV